MYCQCAVWCSHLYWPVKGVVIVLRCGQSSQVLVKHLYCLLRLVGRKNGKGGLLGMSLDVVRENCWVLFAIVPEEGIGLERCSLADG